MKRIILAVMILLSFSMNSQVYINGKKVAESGSSDVSIVNGDVYIDGKSIDELTEEVNEPEPEPVKEKVNPNLYQTKNVDVYNKWYNTKGKKIMEEKKENWKTAIIWVISCLGIVAMFVTLKFVFAEINQRIQKKRSQKIYSGETQHIPKEIKPKIPAPKWSSPLHHDMDLPEVSSPIKNRQTRL